MEKPANPALPGKWPLKWHVCVLLNRPIFITGRA